MNSECQHLHLKKCLVGESVFYKCSDGWARIDTAENLPPLDVRVFLFTEEGTVETGCRAMLDDKLGAWTWVWLIDRNDPEEEEDFTPFNAEQVTHWQSFPVGPAESCRRNFTAEPMQIKVTYPEPSGQTEGCPK